MTVTSNYEGVLGGSTNVLAAVVNTDPLLEFAFCYVVLGDAS